MGKTHNNALETQLLKSHMQ